MSSAGTALEESLETYCTTCGLQAPTKTVSLYQNIGLLVARRTLTVSGPMCRRCISAYFKSFTLTTLFLGWWGMISFVITPFILINNVVRYLMSLNLSEPSPAVANVALGAPASKLVVDETSLTFKLIYSAVVCMVLAGAGVYYYGVGFLEKHAPSVNAQLHSGEITEGADAEYAGMKIFKDIEALNADIKGEGWAVLRTEFLKREPYLVDLREQNGKLQRAFAAERGQSGVDACEQLALDQLAPALDDYTRTTGKFFAALKAAPETSQESVAAVQAAAKEQNGATDRIQKYFIARDAKGCSKK